MNKKQLFLFLLATVLTLPFVAGAQGDLPGMIGTAKQSLVGMAAALSAIAFIVAGIMFLTATANPSRMAIAKGALIAAVIGIVVIILSDTACTFVQNFFGMQSGVCGG